MGPWNSTGGSNSPVQRQRRVYGYGKCSKTFALYSSHGYKILNTSHSLNGWSVTRCCLSVLTHLSILQITSQKVYSQLSFIITQTSYWVTPLQHTHQCTVVLSDRMPGVGGPAIKLAFFLPQTSFLELDHVYICYMTSHVKFG